MMATNLGVDEYRANGAFAALEPNWEKKLNAKILAVGETSAQFYLYLTKKPNLRPDGVIDIKGWKIRTTGAYRPLVGALGATPVQITNAGEVYTALERGVVDGFGWPTVGLASQKLAKLVKYRIDPPFYHLANVVLINLDKWNSLSKPAQDILLKVAAEYEKDSLDNMNQGAKADDAAIKKAGVQVFTMPPAGAKKYLQIAYEAMWKRATSRLDKSEARDAARQDVQELTARAGPPKRAPYVESRHSRLQFPGRGAGGFRRRHDRAGVRADRHRRQHAGDRLPAAGLYQRGRRIHPALFHLVRRALSGAPQGPRLCRRA